MDRRTFTGLSAASLLSTPGMIRAQQSRHVTIVGAGAAGLTAAYHLTMAGADVLVLEAARSWGGRLKRASDFAKVPLDLGAEWIHDDPTVLGHIIGSGETNLGVETIDYRPQTYQFWSNGQLRDFNALRHAYRVVKFYDTTWFGFFEKFILPNIGAAIELNTAVTDIASDGSGVALRLGDGRVVRTDKVLVTVPLSVLQRGLISFSDDLSPPYLSELEHVDFGDGLKAFLKFSERFYPDMLFEGPRSSVLADTWSEKLYYDAAFGKPTDENILGLFTVSDDGLPRSSLDDAALLADILGELVEIFGPIAKSAFLDGIVQNWSREPHILGSYSMSNNGAYDAVDILAPIEGKLFFAGEALGQDAQSTVHGAAFSAIAAVEDMRS